MGEVGCVEGRRWDGKWGGCGGVGVRVVGIGWGWVMGVSGVAG